MIKVISKQKLLKDMDAARTVGRKSGKLSLSGSLDIVYKSPDELIAYAFNNKDHSQEQVDTLAIIIQRFGFNSPIILDGNNTIIAGHGRLLASKKIGLKRVPCIIKSKLTEKESREYRLLDNRIAELATDNIENIQIELEAIQSEWINDLYKDIVPVLTQDQEDKELVEDVVPKPGKKIVVKRGDIFQLGNHVLVFGDATNPEDVHLLMGAEKASMIFTDPPYNVNYKGGGENTSNTILNDKMGACEFELFLERVFEMYYHVVHEKSGAYIFHSTSTQKEFQNSLEKYHFEIKNQLIWNKPMASLGWGDYRWKHEPFFYCTQKGKSANFYGDRTHGTVIDLFAKKSDEKILALIKKARESEKEGKTTIWSMKRENVADYVHPTQKPVELIGYALKNSSKIGEIVVDFFGGSGSTLIACEKHHRRCFMIELDERYVQTIIKRYHQYTEGKQDIKCLNRSIDFDAILYE